MYSSTSKGHIILAHRTSTPADPPHGISAARGQAISNLSSARGDRFGAERTKGPQQQQSKGGPMEIVGVAVGASMSVVGTMPVRHVEVVVPL